MESSTPRRRRRKVNRFQQLIPILLVIVVILGVVALSLPRSGDGPSTESTPGGSTNSTNSTNSTQSTDTTAPSGSTEPTDSTEPIDTTEPTSSTEPTESTQPQPIDLETFFSETVFIGDSITYGLSTYCNMYDPLYGAKFLCASSYAVRHAIVDPEPGNPNIVSLQFRGESVRPEEALAQMGAKQVFIMLGLNDLSFGVDYTLNNWKILLQNIQSACPDIEIYIQSATPLHAAWDSPTKKLNNANMNLYNQGLQALCEEFGCHYVDIASALKDGNGQLKNEYCSDSYCHMSYAGIDVWIETLKNYVSNLNQ